MLNIKGLFAGALLLAAAACTKDKVETPDFNVSAAKTEVKAGEPITFSFTGNADVISFYSGEKGKDYQFKDRTTADGTVGLQLKTQVLYGSQPNNLALVYSTDFTGSYDTVSIRKATWKDITNRFTLSTAAAGAVGTAVTSDVVNISDILPKAGSPIYFAFKYTGDRVASGTATTQRTWRVNSFTLTNTLKDGSILNVASINTAGWLAFDFANAANKWAVATADPVLSFAPNGALTASEDWVVSKGLFATMVNADVATPIKNFNAVPANYTYTYTTPGTYTATFVGVNGNQKGTAGSTKQITIKVN